ncbi:DNA-directed RNA polymerase subunit L [Methanohalophilus sp. RSK]|uniref:DNA-directed RNA polymerase subunit L n=1 Tax=Methanohalophilus sp. RSK TaxID=2485783 RepID=UPI000F43BCB5|nr:DNA-directed RNA polymerase subunit L [Methanohalophilus sp. RSK]RNI13966.1 DNA-directed RNA polymerase subunit L [Methanohalophilus sp. RSK]
MELKIIEKKDDEIKVEIKGESHTLLNMLKHFLLEDEHVDIASYDMLHVSISEPVFYVRTDGKDPVQAIRDAAVKLTAECDEFTGVFEKTLA